MRLNQNKGAVGKKQPRTDCLDATTRHCGKVATGRSLEITLPVNCRCKIDYQNYPRREPEKNNWRTVSLDKMLRNM
jgi:hypothetical protein